jgi:serine/threonine protein kinase
MMKMSRRPSHRELSFASAALAKRILSPEELVRATVQWSNHDGDQPFDQWLAEQAAISDADFATLRSEMDVADGVDQDGINTGDSGADSLDVLRQALQRIDDEELQQTVAYLADSLNDQDSGDSRPPVVPDKARFEIREELARGGLGEVYVAHDKQLNRNVALKQIRDRFVDHPDAHERFLMEAEITGRLEHPGVVPVYALGQKSDGHYYYAMRLIRGATLEDEIKSYFAAGDLDSAEQNLHLRGLLRRFIDVCNTIDYAHSRGVIHRDLKPANIMLGKYGETLVVDWGLAKRVDVEEQPTTHAESILIPEAGSGSSATQFGSAVGTPHYMSPEQAGGRLDRIGPATDIYSLGATFYHLLTGQPPQSGSTLERVLESVEQGKFPPPRSVRPGIAKPLEAICLKAMQLRVSDRYESAIAMATDIDRWLADQRVEAYKEPLLVSAGRVLRRHQTIAAAGTVAMILLCAAAVAGSILTQRSQAREQVHAEELRRQEFVRETEDQQQLAQRRSSANADLQFGLTEAAAGRFDSALKFFRQGEQASADESRLDDEHRALTQRANQMDRLVEYQRVSDQAIFTMAMEEEDRTLVLTGELLNQLGVFKHADWWDHLPVEGLDPGVADRIERDVYTHLAIMCSFLGKNLTTMENVSRRSLGLPLPTSDEIDRTIALAHRTADMVLAYRDSQWISHFKEMGRYFDSKRGKIPTPPRWQGDNFVDAIILGEMNNMLSYSGDTGFASALVKQFLRLEGSRQKARGYYVRATEFDPSNPLSHARLGLLDQRDQAFGSARDKLGQAISLRPFLVIMFAARSNILVDQAISVDDAAERKRLLTLAMKDASDARALAPQHEMVYWISANALRYLDQPAQAAAMLLAAISREPPVDMIPLSRWQYLVQGRQPKRVRRMGNFLEDRFDSAWKYTQQLQEDEPANPQYALLAAAIFLELGGLDDARNEAERVLEIASEDTNTAGSIVGHAHAILGDIQRRSGESKQAQDAFAKSLQVDPSNMLAVGGVATTLEQQATDADDPSSYELALAAYDRFAQLAQTDWQSVRAQSGRFRMLVMLDRFADAGMAVDLILQSDRGADLNGLQEFAAAQGAAPMVEKLQALQFEVRMSAAVADQKPARTLPLRNGHFELGISEYWKPWMTTGNCLADAKIVKDSRDDGKGTASLWIKHDSPAAPDSRAVLAQTLPAMPGRRYRLSMWAKGDEATAGGLQVIIDDQWEQPVIQLPGGTFDWQTFQGEFTTTNASPLVDQPGTTDVKIVSTAPGEFWVDDIRIESVDQ